MIPSDILRRCSRFSLVPVVLIVSACADEDSGAPSVPSFSELDAEYIFLDNQITLGTNTMNPPAADTGGATYDGVVSIVVNDASRFGVDQDLTLLGDMNVTTDFQTDTITGTVDNFSDSDSDTYTGQMDIAGNVIEDATGTGTDNAIKAGINGVLTNDRNGVTTSLAGTVGNPNAEFIGDFYGTNQIFIGGTISGELTIGTEDYDIEVGGADGSGTFLGQQ